MQVPSDQNIPFNEKPAMQSQKITQLAIDALKSGKYNQVRINFPNPDMVGHTGDLDATISACTTVDACVKVRLRLCQSVLREGRIVDRNRSSRGEGETQVVFRLAYCAADLDVLYNQLRVLRNIATAA